MPDLIVIIVFGWPAVLASVISTTYGIVKHDIRFVILGGVLAIPFSWYLSGFPAVRSPAITIPLFVFAAAWAIRRDREMLAWILALPLYLVLLFLLQVMLYRPQ